jgi:hypothetical protein
MGFVLADFRLYALMQPYFDKTLVLPDIENVK